MIIIPTLPPRHARKKKPTRPPAIAPVLIAATYASAAHVDLAFDRPVDAAAMDVAAVLVTDGPARFQYRGVGTPTMPSPTIVRVPLELDGSDDVPDVRLFVESGNGIAPAAGGPTWAGVSDLPLPFG